MEYTIGVLNKEHYKAIIDRLDELGYDTHSLGSSSYAFGEGYINIEGITVNWSRYKVSECAEQVTLVDLYTDKLRLDKEHEVEIEKGNNMDYIRVNGSWVASVQRSETYNKMNQLIYLCHGKGVWRDSNGNKIDGHLTFEPN